MKEFLEVMDRGETRTGEHRDCAVRALANASLMEYDDAHELLAYHGRKDRFGTKHETLMNAYIDAGFSHVKTFGTTKHTRFFNRVYGHLISETEKGITLKNFCKKYNKGRYIVVYSGHALAVVNGKVIDTFNSPANKRVTLAFSRP